MKGIGTAFSDLDGFVGNSVALRMSQGGSNGHHDTKPTFVLSESI